ncbi:MAG: TSUP family transporter [Thermodesulfobacteriota bacterium]
MLPYILPSLAAFLTAGLTFFSGFGLGTLLLPVFALFFPLEAAIGLTALVHLANNLFKLLLVGKYADLAIVLRFGLPALAAAFVGAAVLLQLTHLAPLATYQMFGRAFEVTPMKLVVALLMVLFAVVEIHPALSRLTLPPRWLPLGGALSGFFGGVSGHQGALRSAFLLKCGLSKEAFISTGVVIACLVDLTRLAVYAGGFPPNLLRDNAGPLLAAMAAALLGSWLGRRLLPKITMRAVQFSVAALLILVALGLGSGLI